MTSLNADQISVLNSTRTAPSIGCGKTAIGGPMAVLNSNSLAATLLPKDPFLMIDGGHSSFDFIWPAVIPNMGTHLQLFHISDLPVAVGPLVRVWGLTPEPVGGAISPTTGQGGRLWPQDVDPTITEDLKPYGFWIPLEKGGLYTDISGLDSLVTLSTLNAIVSTEFILGGPKTVYLAGCTKIMVVIDTVASGGTATVGMIVGRVVG